MTERVRHTAGSTVARQFYHGTRAELRPGGLVEPGSAPPGEEPRTLGYAWLTPDLDAATWDAELAPGDGPGHIYIVEPTGDVEDAAALPDWTAPGHPTMSWRSRKPLRVTGEVMAWLLYHGTRADLKPGDLIAPGRTANFGERTRTANHVYFARTLDAATWGAELAAGDGPGRIYVVEPTGPIEDDPNLTNRKFRGNPTKSFRSRFPVRVTDEVTDWRGHASEVIKAMKDGLERLARQGLASIDD